MSGEASVEPGGYIGDVIIAPVVGISFSAPRIKVLLGYNIALVVRNGEDAAEVVGVNSVVFYVGVCYYKEKFSKNDLFSIHTFICTS